MSDRHSIKGIRSEFKRQGKFHTPPELAKFLHDLIPAGARDVYDPTCGAGSLLSQFPDETPKFGQDIDEEALADAEQVPGMHTFFGDVLTEPAWSDRRFHAIVANPPFSIKWEPNEFDERFSVAPTAPSPSRADYAFLLHILHMLADDGTAAVLAFPGVLYRGHREGAIRRWMVEQNYIDRVISIPGDTFIDTSIQTACLVLRKNRGVDEPVVFEDREHGIERAVSRSEIEAAAFTLSVSSYVQMPEEEKPAVDPHALEMKAEDDVVRILRAHIGFTEQVSELEGRDYTSPFLNRIESVLWEQRFGVGLGDAA